MSMPRPRPRLSGSPLLRRLAYWLEPRRRDPGWLAFALNRFAGYILIGYLLAHMVVLSQLAAGPDGWNSLLDLFGSTPFLVGIPCSSPPLSSTASTASGSRPSPPAGERATRMPGSLWSSRSARPVGARRLEILL